MPIPNDQNQSAPPANLMQLQNIDDIDVCFHHIIVECTNNCLVVCVQLSLAALRTFVQQSSSSSQYVGNSS